MTALPDEGNAAVDYHLTGEEEEKKVLAACTQRVCA